MLNSRMVMCKVLSLLLVINMQWKSLFTKPNLPMNCEGQHVDIWASLFLCNCCVTAGLL